MVVLNGRKILFVLGIITMFVFTYVVTIANANKISKNSNQSIATVALPVDSKVIIIDAGHGVPDEGAESSTRNYRSRKQFKNSIKSTKFIRTIWCNGNTH